MTVKFDNFVAALNTLCAEHSVVLTTTGYDGLEVWDLHKFDLNYVHVNGIEDETND